MASRGDDRRLQVLLERFGQTYADELQIELAANTPSALFRWLCAAILYSARIGADQATKAATALTEVGWTTAHAMAASSWQERVDVLNRSGYARYDESYARNLGDTADFLVETYDGDLRRLRAAAGEEPARERELLQACKGLGEVGAQIFCREAQVAWPELYPFCDRKALNVARNLELGGDAAALAERVPRDDYARLVAALVRCGLARAQDEIKKAAR